MQRDYFSPSGGVPGSPEPVVVPQVAFKNLRRGDDALEPLQAMALRKAHIEQLRRAGFVEAAPSTAQIADIRGCATAEEYLMRLDRPFRASVRQAVRVGAELGSRVDVLDAASMSASDWSDGFEQCLAPAFSHRGINPYKMLFATSALHIVSKYTERGASVVRIQIDGQVVAMGIMDVGEGATIMSGLEFWTRGARVPFTIDASLRIANIVIAGTFTRRGGPNLYTRVNRLLYWHLLEEAFRREASLLAFGYERRPPYTSANYLGVLGFKKQFATHTFYLSMPQAPRFFLRCPHEALLSARVDCMIPYVHDDGFEFDCLLANPVENNPMLPLLKSDPHVAKRVTVLTSRQRRDLEAYSETHDLGLSVHLWQ